MAKDMKSMVDANYLLLAEMEGEPIGFSRGRFEASNPGGEAWHGQFFSALDPPAAIALTDAGGFDYDEIEVEDLRAYEE